MKELRPYQVSGIRSLYQSIRGGVKRIAVQLPCGGGKTLMSATIAQHVMSRGKKLAFTVPRIDLVDQTVTEFWSEGISDVGVIQANHAMTDYSKPIQICSIDTVSSRGFFPDAAVAIFDEGHLLTKAHIRWMQERPDMIFICLSATPWSLGLGKYFDSLLVVSTMKELMDQGYLCKYRAFGVGDPDLTGIKKVGDDHHQGQLSDRLRNDPKRVADMVTEWEKRWGKDRTLIYAVDRADALIIQEKFQRAGHACGYQDANTPKDERRALREQFQSGAIAGIVSIGTMIIGNDLDVRCISLGVPTLSPIKFVQIFGRGMRLGAPGSDPKDELIFLDHSGVMDKLGAPENIAFDGLDMGNRGERSKQRKVPVIKACPQCQFMRQQRSLICPNCGFKHQPVSRVQTVDGELVELSRGLAIGPRKKGRHEYSTEDKRLWYAMLRGYAREHGKSDKWVLANYKQKFDCWPRGMDHVQPIEPSLELFSWVRSRQIAWAKSKRRAERLQAAE